LSLYTKEIKAVINSKKPPYHGLVYDMVDYNGKYLTLRIYRDNFEEFSDDQKVGISLWISEVMTAVRQIVPCYLEVFESVPRR
jgi:hypothetical protein